VTVLEHFSAKISTNQNPLLAAQWDPLGRVEVADIRSISIATMTESGSIFELKCGVQSYDWGYSSI
jgi:hypothetical protein